MLIQTLKLQPHPEGGYFRETYRAAEAIPDAALPARYGGERPFSTLIYFLLTAESFSAFHRVQSDEAFHFYLGDPVNLTELHPDGRAETITLGADIAAGQSPQHVVPQGVWQALRLAPGGEYALLGATVAPGFDFGDFELARRAELLMDFPQHARLIQALTRG